MTLPTDQRWYLTKADDGRILLVVEERTPPYRGMALMFTDRHACRPYIKDLSAELAVRMHPNPRPLQRTYSPAHFDG